MTRPRALFVFNPAAGRRPRRRRLTLDRLITALARRGWQAHVAESRPTAADFQGQDALLACGGDGTLHALLQCVMSLPAASRPLLGLAPPFGTANVMAHALGCPSHPDAASAWLERAWQRGGRSLPLGVAESVATPRFFLAMAGVGFDAAIVAAMPEPLKRRWGKLAFAARACTAWRGYFPAPIEIETSTPSRLSADGLLFSLTRFYAGTLRLGRPVPGEALILALRGAPRFLPLQALALATVGLCHAPGVRRLSGSAVTVATPGRPIQLDGEPAGTTPVRLRLDPDGIRFLAPT